VCSSCAPVRPLRLALFYFLLLRPPPRPPLFPYTTLFRSRAHARSPHRSGGAARRIVDGGAPRRAARRAALRDGAARGRRRRVPRDRKSTRLNSSHVKISYAVFCLKKKKSPVANKETRASS